MIETGLNMKRYMPLIILLLYSGMSKSYAQDTGQTNLLKDPGFENFVPGSGVWHTGGPVKSMEPKTMPDMKVHFSGSCSLKMESNNPACHGVAVQKVNITGGKTYRASARFLAENVGSIDKSVLFRIKWFSNSGPTGYDYISGLEGDDGGWLLASGMVKAPEGSTSAEIALEFRWSMGSIRWDDISLTECAEAAARKIKVGSIHYRPEGPAVADNVSAMARLLDQAGRAGCDIVCLPEGWPTCNTGTGMTKVEANTLGGSASAMMAAKARQYGMYIVSGLYDWRGDTLYNIAALYDRQGKIQGIYKKVQLPDSEAEVGAVPGNSLPVFTTDFGTIGILICWDIISPEIARILALKGAELILCPIWGDVRTADSWKVTARSRAMDNGIYFVTSIYDGHSLIVDPAGEVMKETGTQGTLLTADIDLGFNPPWSWIGNAGRGTWRGVWRKDRRSDLFSPLGDHRGGH